MSARRLSSAGGDSRSPWDESNLTARWKDRHS